MISAYIQWIRAKCSIMPRVEPHSDYDQACLTNLELVLQKIAKMYKKIFPLILIIMVCSGIYAQTWLPLGPFGSEKYSLKNSAWGGGTGQIYGFAFAPQSNSKGNYDWYCVSPWGGLWKSVNEGKNWIDLNPQLEQVAGICSGIDVAIDARQASTIYVATGRIDKDNKADAPCVPSTGVYRSVDGGMTFQQTGLKFNYEDNNHIPRLVANPWSKEGTIELFAATDKGLFASQADVEKKWTKVFDNDRIFTIEISPNYPANNTIYASGDDVYISTKHGSKNSFHAMEPSISTVLPATQNPRVINIRAVSRNGVDIIYALVYQDKQDYFLCYDGSKWEVRNTPAVSGIYIPTQSRMGLAVNPDSPDNVYVGITYVTRTDDGGKRWQLAGRYCQPGSQNDPQDIHGDIHAVTFIPHSNDVMIGTDGGAFRYVAADKKDIELNTGLNISQVIGMSAPPLVPHRIMIGKQDTGYDIYDGSEWTNFFGGDGYSVVASPIDSTLYLCNYGHRFVAGDNPPQLVSPSCKSREDALFQNVAYDPKAPKRCFVAGTNISYTNDGAKTLITIYKYHTATDQPVDFGTQMETMAVGHDDNSGASIIYATNYGFYNGAVCKMIRGRIIPRAGSDGKPCEEDLCSTCWGQVSLPNEKMEWLDNTSYSVSGIAVSQSDPDELWICYDHNLYDKDDLKVFHSTDGGASWDYMDEGLPAYTVCTIIKYDDKTKFLYLGTSTGIFINKNEGSGWKPFGQGLPKCHVKALEIQQGIRKIRAGLYGRGVWETDLPVN
jgi:hypothetical protein